MSPRQIDIADMKCWLIRMAQTKWNMPASQVARIFEKKNGVFVYIDELYDLLHLSSYECALADIERYLSNRGVVPC